MIKLMTYNICRTEGMDNIKSVGRIADVIRESGAQIVCLQEVTSNQIDQPAELASRLQMNCGFKKNITEGDGYYGTAMLTSFDIVEEKHHFLTSVGEQRGVHEVHIKTPEGIITVFCTHFGLETDERFTQASELADIINAVSGPKVACGDFNEEAKDPGVAALISKTSLVDVDPNGTLTFDSVNPTCRIDMILCDPSIKAENVTVIKTQASDHMPLVADLSIS